MFTTKTYEKTEENLTILQRIAIDDKHAVRECVDKYGKLIWSMARKFTYTREDAEDVVQEVFIEIWKYAGRYDRTKSSEITFVALLARRKLIDCLRKAKRHPQFDCSIDAVPDIPNQAERKLKLYLEVKQAVKVINLLRPEQSKIVKMSVIEGMSHNDISQATGIPLGTVKSKIRNGLQRVRREVSYSFS